MLVYEKKVDDARKLFGTLDKVPADADAELTYKDSTGTVLTPIAGDTYVDGNSSGGVQRIVRKSDSKTVSVFIGSTRIIGDEPVTPVVTTTKSSKKKETVEEEEDVQ